jgi:UDP-2,3-diacylglucosamine hydrolase
MLKLKEGAILLGDAHYSHLRPQLLPFLKAIETGEIGATQLILMGDIFDQLFGGIDYTVQRNFEAVETIRNIAARMEVIYLEGNHDFQLRSIFKHIRIFPIEEQPVTCEYEGQRLLLAHGDFGADFGYRLYTGLIRNKAVLWVLRHIDRWTGHSIVHWVDEHNGKKEDCNDFTGFEAYIRRHLAVCDLHDIRWVIEGHYHQNRSFDVDETRYINLAAFACNQRYFELKSAQSEALLEELEFGKE